ncbi:GNAT family N-acetyltransferase [Streptomyces sp. NPDC127036]|uniref:GNAT family N-acetyltransferase n=1 Tax=Streptomyces sp. NPDC127036 TaxID=3347112 RepID=UPI00365DE53D
MTANFRRYLLGWGQVESTKGELDHYRSGIDASTFNGVVRTRSLDTFADTVAFARARMAGVPWLWWVGPDSPKGTSDALTALGSVQVATMPLMVRSLASKLDDEESTAGLRVEIVEEQSRLVEFIDVYRTSMGLSPEKTADLARIEAQRSDNADIVRVAAISDGTVVGTTEVITAHEVAGLFIVHVAESHRRRGVGGALTAAALRIGQERGMKQAALIASPAGAPLYRRHSFAPVAEYRLHTFPV